jgi:hypothetical protein
MVAEVDRLLKLGCNWIGKDNERNEEGDEIGKKRYEWNV